MWWRLLPGRNRSSGSRGFTLVEVIVVAVIVAVLAGAAVLLYQGFVTQARQTAVTSLAETAGASANSLYRKTGQPVNNVNDLHLYYNANKYNVNFGGNASNGTGTVTVTENRTNGLSATVNY